MSLHQLPRKGLSLQELARRDCHFTNSLGGKSLHQLLRSDFNSKNSLHQLPRRDVTPPTPEEGTITPRTPEEGTITPRTPEEGLSLQELPRRDCNSTHSRGETVTPRTPEEGLSLHKLPSKKQHTESWLRKGTKSPNQINTFFLCIYFHY